MDKLTIEIVLNVHCFFNDIDKTYAWLKTKNPLLGDLSPLDLIKLGKGRKILKFVINCIDENKEMK